MKRCIRRFINWRARVVGTMSWQGKVGFALELVLAIIVVVICLSVIYDTTFWLIALGSVLFIGIFTYGLGGLVFTILIFSVQGLWESICKRIKSNNSK